MICFNLNRSLFHRAYITFQKGLSEIAEIALSGASKLASTYFTLFYRSVNVLYTGLYQVDEFDSTTSYFPKIFCYVVGLYVN